MIRVAAAGDLHAGTDAAGTIREGFEHIEQQADVLVLAGDLTRRGLVEEAAVLVEELGDVGIPKVAVLGNHDHHSGRQEAVTEVLEEGGIRVLEGEGMVVDLPGGRLGIAGVKGFGGGFPGANATEFGEEEMKAFIRHTHVVSEQLGKALDGIRDADLRIALTHYAPVEQTLAGERLEIFPFLGSYLLAEAADASGADLMIHGHAHKGREKGITPGGIHVRNVALPVINRTYALYCLGDDPAGPECDPPGHAR
ncbi:MAG: metallophosphoesterase [Actinomycetota bacterium]|nr:metallophosphoesterase [Actinomycetota bacterium]